MKPDTFRLLAAPLFLGLMFGPVACSEDEEPVGDPCDQVVCDEPPAPTCDGDVVVSYSADGTCVDGECEYEMIRAPCSQGHTCEAGECVPVLADSCEDIEPCDTPPAAQCVENAAMNFAVEGTCQEDEQGARCVYDSTEETCEEGHQCELVDGEAVCLPVYTGENCADIEPCESPPDARCDDNTAINYEAEGTCVEDDQGARCDHEKSEDQCGEAKTCAVEEGVATCVPLTCVEIEPCDDPPPAQCEDGFAVNFADDGTCTEDEHGATCTYERSEEDCGAHHCVVDEGVAGCVVPTCEDITCDSPHPAECVDNTAVNYEAEGTCEDGEEGPTCTYAAVETNCSNDQLACEVSEGVAQCLDLCPAEGCLARQDGCDEEVMVTYLGLLGTCDWLTGECVYPPEDETREPCDASEICLVDQDGGPYCVEPICGVAPPPSRSSLDGGYCDREACSNDPTCEFGANFDFETWIDGELPGFYAFASSAVSLLEDDVVVNTGSSAARFVSTASNSNRDLRAAVSLKDLALGESYTFHAWYRLEPGRDDDWVRLMLWLRDENGSLDRNGEPTYWAVEGDMAPGAQPEWTELTVTSYPVEADRADLRPYFRVRSRTTTPTTAWMDDWAVTLPYDFTLDPETRDPEDRTVATSGNYYVGAAINNAGTLYVSTDGASGGLDRFVFVWVGGTDGESQVPVPWGKQGTVPGPAEGALLLALIQEEDPDSAGYCEWRQYDTTDSEWKLLSTGAADGTCTSSLGAHLAGTVELTPHFGDEAPSALPRHIHLLAAGFGTGEDSVNPSTMVPPTDNGLTTVRVTRAAILAGKVHQ